VRVYTKLTQSEFRLFVREPVLVFFGVFFPSILVIILGSIPAFRKPVDELGGATVVGLYVNIAVLLLLAMLALQATPLVLATYRERGVLRRLETTPARPITLLAAQLSVSLGTAIVSAVLVLAIGRIFFSVALAAQFGSFLIGFVLAAVAIFAIGLFIAAVVPNAKAAQSTGTLLFFPLMFFAGLWVPRESMPKLLQRIADFTPLGAAERALHDAAGGHWINGLSLTVLIAYILVFGAAAAKLFRWE
jgi:ABC-2 type transport system permease protein